MKTDRQLQEDVLKALDFEPGVNASKIGVSVRNGIVTLQGFVRSYFEKTTAERVTRHVHGVLAIANDLAVTLDGVGPRSDTAVAEAVINAISWDSAVPIRSVKATVSDGWITLSGTVDWQFQKLAAQKDAERLQGVKGVINLINLTPRHVDVADLKSKIENAFKRSAEIDSANVKVQALDGEVILSGTVHSLSERDEAERAAWAAPGVLKVQARITVAPV